MKLAPWNPVRIGAAAYAFRCAGCEATSGTGAELSVMGFMRLLRKFERDHRRCAITARLKSADEVALKVLKRAAQK
jgi:hypothetical protein